MKHAVSAVQRREKRQEFHERRAISELSGDHGVLAPFDIAFKCGGNNRRAAHTAIILEPDDYERRDVRERQSVEDDGIARHLSGICWTCQQCDPRTDLGWHRGNAVRGERYAVGLVVTNFDPGVVASTGQRPQYLFKRVIGNLVGRDLRVALRLERNRQSAEPGLFAKERTDSALALWTFELHHHLDVASEPSLRRVRRPNESVRS